MAAMDYLPIQGSAVPCERVFSSAKETMADRRNRILYGLMEQLQMLKFAFNKGDSEALHFTSGTEEKDIIAYLESTPRGWRNEDPEPRVGGGESGRRPKKKK